MEIRDSLLVVIHVFNDVSPADIEYLPTHLPLQLTPHQVFLLHSELQLGVLDESEVGFARPDHVHGGHMFSPTFSLRKHTSKMFVEAKGNP